MVLILAFCKWIFAKKNFHFPTVNLQNHSFQQQMMMWDEEETN